MITIRQAKQDDLPELAAMYARSFSTMHPNEHWSNETAERFLSSCLHRQPDLSFIAEMKGEMVGGFFVAIRPWYDGNHLVDGELFVEPKHQRKTIGSQLLQHGIQEAQSKYQATIMEALTFSENAFPLTWYKKMGFTVVEDMVIIRSDLSSLGK